MYNHKLIYICRKKSKICININYLQKKELILFIQPIRDGNDYGNWNKSSIKTALMPLIYIFTCKNTIT